MLRRFYALIAALTLLATLAASQPIELCELPRESVQDRLNARNMPSIFLPWDSGILGFGLKWANPDESYVDRAALHGLWWHGPGHTFRLEFKLFPDGYQLVGDMSWALDYRDQVRARNPNMIFLADMRQAYAGVDRFGEDWFGWLRDDEGNLVIHGDEGGFTPYTGFGEPRINWALPEVQDVIVQRAIAITKCGLYDGIVYDAWEKDRSTPEEEWYTTLQRIREGVPDDFLILLNTNRFYIPEVAPYINGAFMETFPRIRSEGYDRDRIIEIETNLIKYEKTVMKPQINCLRGLGIGSESPDSPNNRKWMRLFSTMSLTCSDGYVIYTLGDIGGQRRFQDHIQHPFWRADLGQPISDIAQSYQEIEGLYIREFTNGWAVYNRSGSPSIVEFPEIVQSKRSGLEATSHAVLDLDGDIFIRIETPNPADANKDGTVNILDLVIVAQSLGTGENDVNGDGVTNVFDLVIIANAINK